MSVVDDGLTRSLFGSGKERAAHNAVSTGSESLHDVARIAESAVGNDRNSCLGSHFGNIEDGCKLRNADSSHDTCGAN